MSIASRLSHRLSLVEDVALDANDTGSSLLVVVAERDRCVYSEVVSRSGLDARRVTLLPVDTSDPSCRPATIVERIAGAIDTLRRPRSAGSLSAAALVAVIDLDALFALTQSTVDKLDAVTRLDDIVRDGAADRPAATVELVSPLSIPKGFGEEFLSLHSRWLVDSESTERDIAAASLHLSGEVTEWRSRYLELLRTGGSAAADARPLVLGEFRRGVLLLSLDFTIRYASERAADLLGVSVAQLVDRPLSVHLDGVDLATLRREAARVVAGGTSAPFVASWRLAPGHYEPREVTIDQLTAVRVSVGYIVSIARVETVRGPRAAYRDSRENAVAANGEDASDEMLVEENLDSLDGTPITRREHEVLLLILQDKTNREISRHLNIAEVTVKKHLTSVYRKLRITNRRELARSFSVPRDDGTKRS